jgi:hypothetical protein
MSDPTQPPPRGLGQLFSALPRELRDHIFFYIVSDDSNSPLRITNSIIQLPWNDPSIAEEWLEAIYTHRPCTIVFPDPNNPASAPSKYIWGSYPEYKHFIRHLIVDAPEASLYSDEDLVGIEWECARRFAEVRQDWLSLFALTKLESLTICLQKNKLHSFSWANFSPIVYELRERKPNLRVKMYITFDAVLERAWDTWQPVQTIGNPWNNGVVIMEQYLPMGYADVSELIHPPTAEDHVYVEWHLSGVREVGYRDLVRGLLDETPASRRQLAQHYLVKEPALLRVLMEEHYEVYKRSRGDRGLLEAQ